MEFDSLSKHKKDIEFLFKIRDVMNSVDYVLYQNERAWIENEIIKLTKEVIEYTKEQNE